ncbi:quinohemoprotein amine dehydrogenase subunit beta [Halarcobacter sp.]|uniref:quinohemoprotein amine dehydrogenase subunit beta n=1 Tax=Halarcobacter sp. TaxID=2321133 RepID=UPI002AA94931|nr:quinohemoprotein amine dehydrogenase subunit beta [Halarcobacter sp.]
MKKIYLITTVLLGLLVSGCSINEPNIADNKVNNKQLKKDRDYIVSISKKNELHIVDGKTEKLYKTCKLKGTFSTAAMVVSPDGTKVYALQDAWQAIYGYDLNSCENFFSAKLSSDGVRAPSIFSLALSNDGKKLYSISNPTKILKDRYQVMDSVFKTFNTNDGLDAEAMDSFKVPRQITIMMTAKDGSVYAAGPNLYKIDPALHKVEIASKLRFWDRPNYSVPDILALWPSGQISNEMLLLYVASKYDDSTQKEDTAKQVWGATRVNLNTGKIEQGDFAPLENLMFTGMTDPNDSNILFGVLTDLTKFDRKNQKVLKRVWLDHTYYQINFSTDGSKIYLGGTYNDIAVYDPKTLKKLNNIQLPKGDVALGTMQVFRVK